VEAVAHHDRHLLIAGTADHEGTVIDEDADRFIQNLVALFDIRLGDALLVQLLKFIRVSCAGLRFSAFLAAGLVEQALQRPGTCLGAAQWEDPVWEGPNIQLGGMCIADHELTFFEP